MPDRCTKSWQRCQNSGSYLSSQPSQPQDVTYVVPWLSNGAATVPWNGGGVCLPAGRLVWCTSKRSTDDFILTLRQFTSRRGPPEDIICDNRSNFTGADREPTRAIEEWNQQLIVTEMQQRGNRFSLLMLHTWQEYGNVLWELRRDTCECCLVGFCLQTMACVIR
jgi:hypothetical protein